MTHADRISAVLVEAGSGPCRIPQLEDRPVCVLAAPAAADALARLCPGAEVVCDAPLRTGLRVVDRRSTPDKGATLEEVIGRDEKVVVYAAGREECVQLAQHLRAQHDGLTRRVGYLHGGLPARVRHIVAQAFREVLAAVYRELRRWRGDAAWAWPDDATWAHLSRALPDLPRSAVDGAVAIFEEAGLATREIVLGRSEVQLLPALRRDLGASLRYREGRRERDAFEEFARWALRAGGFELLQAAAGQGGGA